MSYPPGVTGAHPHFYPPDDPGEGPRLPIEGTYRCRDCRRPVLVFSEKRAAVIDCPFCGGDARRS